MLTINVMPVTNLNFFYCLLFKSCRYCKVCYIAIIVIMYLARAGSEKLRKSAACRGTTVSVNYARRNSRMKDPCASYHFFPHSQTHHLNANQLFFSVHLAKEDNTFKHMHDDYTCSYMWLFPQTSSSDPSTQAPPS